MLRTLAIGTAAALLLIGATPARSEDAFATVMVTAFYPEGCAFAPPKTIRGRLINFGNLTNISGPVTRTLAEPISFTCASAERATITIRSDGFMDRVTPAGAPKAQIPYEISVTSPRGASQQKPGQPLIISGFSAPGAQQLRAKLTLEFTALGGWDEKAGAHRYASGDYSDTVRVSATVN